MKTNVLILFTFLVALFVQPASMGQSVTIKAKDTPPLSIPLNVRHLSTGPRELGRRGLRVCIVIEEIYPSIYLEEIAYGNVEGDPDLVTTSYYLNGFDVARAFGYRWLEGLRFMNWISWNKFEMEDSRTHFRISYHSDGQVEMEKLDTK